MTTKTRSKRKKQRTKPKSQDVNMRMVEANFRFEDVFIPRTPLNTICNSIRVLGEWGKCVISPYQVGYTLELVIDALEKMLAKSELTPSEAAALVIKEQRALNRAIKSDRMIPTSYAKVFGAIVEMATYQLQPNTHMISSYEEYENGLKQVIAFLKERV